MTITLRKQSVEGTELAFIGDCLVGTAEKIAELQQLGAEILVQDGVPLAYRDGTYYSICGSVPRAFKVGTRCHKGDVHYVPESKTEYLEAMANHYSMFMPLAGDKIATASGIKTFVPGRGEWVAQTEGDALEMAVAFSRESEAVAMARAIAYNSGHSNILLAYRTSQVQNAVHYMPKRMSLVYENGMVIVDRAGASVLEQYGVKDGSEICIRFKSSKTIGRYLAVRGDLDSYFTNRVGEVQVSQPITLTLPLDYPVFVG